MTTTVHSRLVQSQAVGSFPRQNQEDPDGAANGRQWAGYLKQLAVHTLGTRLDARMQERAHCVLSGMQVRRSDRILNLRCGLGYEAFTLGAQYQAHVDAMDADAQKIELARLVRQKAGLHNVGLYHAQDVPLRFLAECFDKVLVSEPVTAELLTEGLLSEVNRVLVPGGTLVLVMAGDGIATADGGSPDALEGLRSACGKMGFDITGTEHCSERSAALRQQQANDGSSLRPLLVQLETGLGGAADGEELIVTVRKVRRHSYHTGNGCSIRKQE